MPALDRGRFFRWVAMLIVLAAAALQSSCGGMDEQGADIMRKNQFPRDLADGRLRVVAVKWGGQEPLMAPVIERQVQAWERCVREAFALQPDLCGWLVMRMDRNRNSLNHHGSFPADDLAGRGDDLKRRLRAAMENTIYTSPKENNPAWYFAAALIVAPAGARLQDCGKDLSPAMEKWMK